MGSTRRVPGSTGRDFAIDATRGLAIWSMISLHFADGTKIAAPTHAFPHVDGMSAFVLLSGLVLGIVYRRWIGRHGLRYAYGRLTRRLGSLYAAQLFISLVAIAVGLTMSAREFWAIAVLPAHETVGAQLWWAVTMRFLPSGGNILLLYMLLMASAYVLLPLLARNLWAPIVVASLALYEVSQISDASVLMIRSSPGGLPVQNWAAWQVLFVPAMVIGWRWDDWQIPRRIDDSLAWLIGGTAIAWLALNYGHDLRAVLRRSPDLIDKLELGPVRVLVAWLVVACVYGVFRRLLQWTDRDWLRPLTATGSRSLDSYVVQATALLVIPAWLWARPWDAWPAMLIALSVFAACWAWAEFRTRMQVDKLHRLPARMLARAAPPPEQTVDDASSGSAPSNRPRPKCTPANTGG
ncbi:MAG: OpgC domain-containing protein [Gordonia sp. (in: high G+C Gram-positive bacteria)]